MRLIEKEIKCKSALLFLFIYWFVMGGNGCWVKGSGASGLRKGGKVGERFAGAVGVWFAWGECAGFMGCGERKEFARLCICRKGERVLSYWAERFCLGNGVRVRLTGCCGVEWRLSAGGWANGWRERRGQAARERGLASLCESGRERMVERAVKRCGRVCRSRGALWLVCRWALS